MCTLQSDLWGLSSSASSLSPLAWRMNGPLSALPHPPPLRSLKLPFFFSVLPFWFHLHYLISPHALPLHAPCHLRCLLRRPVLSHAHLVDLILLCLSGATLPLARSPSSVTANSCLLCGSGLCSDQILTSNLISDCREASSKCDASIRASPYLLFISCLFQWLDVKAL